METSYSVLSTLATSGGNISLSAGMLNITGCPQNIVYKKIISANGGLKAATAATPGVITITQSPSGANSTVYKFTFQQDAGQGLVSRVVAITSDSSATNLEISTSLKNMFNSLNFQATAVVSTVATANDSITITAATDYEVITGSSIANGSCSYTLTTTGVYSQQTYARLSAAPYLVTGLSSGKTYSALTLNYGEQTVEANGIGESLIRRHVLYVQDDASNYAAFAVRIGEVLNDWKYSTQTADPEAISLI